MIKTIPYTELTVEKARAGCFVTDMPNAAYHAYEGISNSGLSMVARSPAHYAYRAAWKQTRAMEIGTAFHTALLEPERFTQEYMTVTGINDRRKSEYKEAAKVYGADATLTDSEGTSVAVMMESVLANPDAQNVLTADGWAELSAFVQDPETGVLLRCRFDWIASDGRAVDIKKTQDARADAFSRSVLNYRYHCQQAMYSDVFEKITGRPLESYRFLAIEEQPPCANVLYTLDDVSVMVGMQEYKTALMDYAIANKSNDWPAYSETSALISLPEWALNEIEGEIV